MDEESREKMQSVVVSKRGSAAYCVFTPEMRLSGTVMQGGLTMVAEAENGVREFQIFNSVNHKLNSFGRNPQKTQGKC